MYIFSLNSYKNNRRWTGLIAVLVCIVAWSVELAGVVYICPYCRVQRTVIGILGLFLALNLAKHWIVKYVALVVGFFGAVVAANQHFMGWKKISAGTFEFHENIMVDPFILSGLAMTLIIGLVYLNMYSKS